MRRIKGQSTAPRLATTTLEISVGGVLEINEELVSYGKGRCPLLETIRDNTSHTSCLKNSMVFKNSSMNVFNVLGSPTDALIY
jgi:hypothetical protein